MIKWDEEKRQFLKDNVKGISLKELTERFNKQFSCDASLRAISCQKKKLGLKSGIVGGQFKKGNIPFNKGKKMPKYVYEKCKATMFKKGNIPVNYRHVGSERINRDGYVEIKVKDPNKWELKHRVLYKQYYGEIPNGHVVIFADGNKLNFDKENLIAISKNEHARLNQNNLRYNTTEATKSAINLAKLIIKMSEIKKRK